MRIAFEPLLLAIVLSPALASPLFAAAPEGLWPKFRANMQQNGRSPLLPRLSAEEPWVFRSAKGIFSSPVIDKEGRIYIGSADRHFYALSKTGEKIWSLKTGEIIDSSALLDDKGRAYVGSGDGFLRCVDRATGDVCWTFAAEQPAETGAYINWFEGNVAMSVDGSLLAPNDNFRLYNVNPKDGTRRWAHKMLDQSWSSPAVDAETGTIYLGSNYIAPFAFLQPFFRNIYALKPDGTTIWTQSVQASVAASPMLSQHGLLLVGAFDGKLRAYDKKDGKLVWSFTSLSHIYASPAELSDGTVIQAGADGLVYALDGKSGALKWTFSSLEPIRSSPAVDGQDRIYFGSGDGALYVLNADGSLRYRMQLIQEDRNDLNASPALSDTAVVLAGENGEIFSVPYDYCLRGHGDARCSTEMPIESDGVRLSYITPFGSYAQKPMTSVASAESLRFGISAFKGGKAEAVSFDEAELLVETQPAVPVTMQVTGDGRTLVLSPKTSWPEGDFQVRLRLGYRRGLGNARLETQLDLQTRAVETLRGSLYALKRLAVPNPEIMPSYNQIGFDSLSYVVRILDEKADKGTAWIMPAGELADGSLLPDESLGTSFAIGWYRGPNGMYLENQNGFQLSAMNFNIPFQSFRLEVLSHEKGRALLGAVASASCAKIPTYGYFLRNLGFCSPKEDRLTLAGAAELLPLPAPLDAGKNPDWNYRKDIFGWHYLTVNLAAEGPLALVLADADTNLPLAVEYKHLKRRDGQLTLPFALETPRIRAYLLSGGALLGVSHWKRNSWGQYEAD